MDKSLRSQYLLGKTSHLFIWILGLVSLALNSCVLQRDVEYLQERNRSNTEYIETEINDYRLRPYDELFIQISSLDDPTNNVLSGTSASQSSGIISIQPYGASLISYAVNKQGELNFPLVGVIHVQDKTLLEVTEMIKDSLSSILSQPIITVKLVNRYVSVLGEVKNAGHFAYSQEKLSIFDAISLAGDISAYGDKECVIITRNENGKNIRQELNLTKSNILASQYYYLRPGDLVYVRPLKKKFWGMSQFPYSMLLSTISTALLIYTVVK